MMSTQDAKEDQECPVCNRKFPISNIEIHVNKCIFLNTIEETPPKRKRTPSPSLLNRQSSSNNNNVKYEESPSNSKTKPLQKKIKGDDDKQLSFVIPLAKQIQPKCLNDFVGQQHVFGQKTILRTLFEKLEIPNMILWGPPGCGKTSLAGVIQGICKDNPSKFKFVSLCAATAGVKDVQNIVTIAKNDLKFNRQTILFMDEIHRFNKKQQDTFLLNVERGDIILIGATTENPSFSINNALLSRCRVIVFEKLDTDSLIAILTRAAESLNIGLFDADMDKIDFKPHTKLCIEKSALVWLAEISDGDARIALTNLQLVFQDQQDNKSLITVSDIKDKIKKSHMLYDRRGEEHYNTISALHKSVRGGDENGALYWLGRLLSGGEDPLFVARRLVRAAAEDVGNADPSALPLAVSTMQGCQLLGMPECDVLLAQCTIYLARAPKSREADTAYGRVKKFIANFAGPQPSVPMHLRNAPTKLMKDLGYGKRDGQTSSSFMPQGYENIDFFSD